MQLPLLENNVSRKRIGSVTEIPSLLTLTEKEATAAIAQAREMARFLVNVAGPEKVQQLLAALGQSADVDTAFQQVSGTDVSGMETAWGEALIRGYADDNWLEIVNGFDQDAALAHIVELTKPEYGGGRQDLRAVNWPSKPSPSSLPNSIWFRWVMVATTCNASPFRTPPSRRCPCWISSNPKVNH